MYNYFQIRDCGNRYYEVFNGVLRLSWRVESLVGYGRMFDYSRGRLVYSKGFLCSKLPSYLLSREYETNLDFDGTNVESSQIVCNFSLKGFSSPASLSKFIGESIDDFEFRKELSK